MKKAAKPPQPAAPPQKIRYLLIDFENVQKVDISKTAGDVHILIFMGENQKNIPAELVIHGQKLGSRLEWKKIQGNGKNALDFVIAYYLGRLFNKYPQAQCTVLSKDTGFDPLIKLLKLESRDCRRAAEIPADMKS